MTAGPPLSEEEIAVLLRPLEGHHLLLAVSGGPDSMALLHVVDRWRRGRGTQASDIQVATVDHDLRSESAAEATWVGNEAARLGLGHSVLTWADAKPRTGVQAAARDARYGLLAGHAKALWGGNRPTAIVTGHHLNDQAETVLMRLARGSGLDGLAAMRVRSQRNGMLILRPFLTIPKDRLLATLNRAGLSWRDDPSNESDRFERIRIRTAMATLAALSITPTMIARSAGRLARARDCLDIAAARLIDRQVNHHDGLYAQLELEHLVVEGQEIAVRVLNALVRAFGGAAPEPRLSKLENLLSDLIAASGATPSNLPLQRTLGGTTLHLSQSGTLKLWREAGRTPLATRTISIGHQVQWDERFELSLSAAAEQFGKPDAFSVGPLGALGFTRLKAWLGAPALKPFPRAACITLPAIYIEDRLAGIPYFGAMLAEAAGKDWPLLPPACYRQYFVAGMKLASQLRCETGTALDWGPGEDRAADP